VALGVFHPDEAAVAGMAFVEVANAGRKRIAGRNLGSVA
jgi:hypothetical protein